MEEIIVDIKKENHLINKYNKKKVSHELIEYIMKQAKLVKWNKDIKLVINKNSDIKQDSINLIKNGLEEEFTRSIERKDKNNIKQVFYFILGTIIIFISTLIPEIGPWKEVVLITGWVLIWEMIEVELFPDAYGRRNRRVIRKLLKSEMIENKVED